MKIIKSAKSYIFPSSVQAEGSTQRDKVNLLAKKNLESQGNGDFVLTSGRSLLYCFIDFIGGGRQVAAATQTSAQLLPHVSHSVSKIAGAIIPFGLLITGPIVTAVSAKWILPDGHKALKDARQELKDAKKVNDPDAKKEAKHAIFLAKLGLGNLYSMLGMGLAQTASGVTMMLTPEVAKVFHYAPVLKGAAAKAALTTTNVALGAVYAVRGGIMLYRTYHAYQPVREMRKKFNENITLNPRLTLQMLEQEEAKGDLYFERRVDPNSLDFKNDKGEVVGKYTAKGLINAQGEIIDESIEAKREYLRRVDKGIYTQALKHRVALVIAGAMIVGGITAVILSIVTAGVFPIIVGLVSALFFICMEYLFLAYDSTPLFDKLRDRLYKPNADLLGLEKWLQEESWAERLFGVNILNAS